MPHMVYTWFRLGGNPWGMSDTDLALRYLQEMYVHAGRPSMHRSIGSDICHQVFLWMQDGRIRMDDRWSSWMRDPNGRNLVYRIAISMSDPLLSVSLLTTLPEHGIIDLQGHEDIR
jgi:hypothetical protein